MGAHRRTEQQQKEREGWAMEAVVLQGLNVIDHMDSLYVLQAQACVLEVCGCMHKCFRNVFYFVITLEKGFRGNFNY